MSDFMAALEALRDDIRSSEMAAGQYALESIDRAQAQIAFAEAERLRKFRLRLDALLQGAGHLHAQEQKDDLARMDTTGDVTDSRTAPENEPVPPRKKEGTWPQVCVQRAFVEGAKWWEYHSTQFTMWPSDRDLAEDEAVRRYGEPAC